MFSKACSSRNDLTCFRLRTKKFLGTHPKRIRIHLFSTLLTTDTRVCDFCPNVGKNDDISHFFLRTTHSDNIHSNKGESQGQLPSRTPANQHISPRGARVSTPCGAVSTPRITVFVHVLFESSTHGRIYESGKGAESSPGAAGFTKFSA